MTKTTELESVLEQRLEREREKMKALEGFLPKHNLVLVRIDTKDVSEGGILLPEQRKERPVIGIVVAKGPLVTTSQIGERVLFGRFAGVEVELPSGEKMTSHRVLRDVEIYGGWPTG